MLTIKHELLKKYKEGKEVLIKNFKEELLNTELCDKTDLENFIKKHAEDTVIMVQEDDELFTVLLI